MWSYRRPHFESLLLTELQRQQKNSMWCDTVLRADGISIPAHSCVLAAVSPHFSHVFSSAPHLPAGRNHLLEFHTLSAGTLIKLVGLLYSGELEGHGETEREELIAATCRLGIRGLVRVCKEEKGETQESPNEGEQESIEEVTRDRANQVHGLDRQWEGCEEIGGWGQRKRRADVNEDGRLMDTETQTCGPLLTDKLTDKETQTSVSLLTDKLTDKETQTSVSLLTDKLTDTETQTCVSLLTDKLTDKETQTSVSLLTEKLTDTETQTSASLLTDTETQTCEPLLTNKLTDTETQTSRSLLTDKLTDKETQTCGPLLTDKLTDTETQTSVSLLIDELTDTETQTSVSLLIDELTDTETQTGVPLLTDRLTDAGTQTNVLLRTDRLTDTGTQAFMAVMMDSVKDAEMQTSMVVMTDSDIGACMPASPSATQTEGCHTALTGCSVGNIPTVDFCVPVDVVTAGSSSTRNPSFLGTATLNSDAIGSGVHTFTTVMASIGPDVVIPGPAPAVVASDPHAGFPGPSPSELVADLEGRPKATSSSCLEANSASKNICSARLPKARTVSEGADIEDDPGGVAMVPTSHFHNLSSDLFHSQVPGNTAYPRQGIELHPASVSDLPLGFHPEAGFQSPAGIAREEVNTQQVADEGNDALRHEEEEGRREFERFDGNIVGFINYFLNSGTSQEKSALNRPAHSDVGSTKAAAPSSARRRGRPRKVPACNEMAMSCQGGGAGGSVEGKGPGNPKGNTRFQSGVASCRRSTRVRLGKKQPPIKMRLRKQPGGRGVWEVVNGREEVCVWGKGVCRGQRGRRGRPCKAAPAGDKASKGTFPILNKQGGHSRPCLYSYPSHIFNTFTFLSVPELSSHAPIQPLDAARPLFPPSPLHAAPLHAQPAPCEDSAEQFEKLLDDMVGLMMGLDGRGGAGVPGSPQPCSHLQAGFCGVSSASFPRPPQYAVAPLRELDSTSPVNITASEAPPTTFTGVPETASHSTASFHFAPTSPLLCVSSPQTPAPFLNSCHNTSSALCHNSCTPPPSSSLNRIAQVCPGSFGAPVTNGFSHGSGTVSNASSLPCAPGTPQQGRSVVHQICLTHCAHSSVEAVLDAVQVDSVEACARPAAVDTCLERGADAAGRGTPQRSTAEADDVPECIPQSFEGWPESQGVKEGTQNQETFGLEGEPKGLRDAERSAASTASLSGGACRTDRLKDGVDIKTRKASGDGSSKEAGIQNLHALGTPVRKALCPADAPSSQVEERTEEVSFKCEQPQKGHQDTSAEPVLCREPSAMSAQADQLCPEEHPSCPLPIPADPLSPSRLAGERFQSAHLDKSKGCLHLSAAEIKPSLSAADCRGDESHDGEKVGVERQKRKIMTRSQTKGGNPANPRDRQGRVGSAQSTGPVKRGPRKKVHTQVGHMDGEREKKRLKPIGTIGEKMLRREGFRIQENIKLETQVVGNTVTRDSKGRFLKKLQSANKGEVTLTKGNASDGANRLDFFNRLKSQCSAAGTPSGHIKKSPLENLDPFKFYLTRLTKFKSTETKQVECLNYTGKQADLQNQKTVSGKGSDVKSATSEQRYGCRKLAQKGKPVSRLKSGGTKSVHNTSTVNESCGLSRKGKTKNVQMKCCGLLTRGKRRRRQEDCEHANLKQGLPEKQRRIDLDRTTGPQTGLSKAHPPRRISLGESMVKPKARQLTSNTAVFDKLGILLSQNKEQNHDAKRDQNQAEQQDRNTHGCEGGEEMSMQLDRDKTLTVDSGPNRKGCERKSGRACKEHISAHSVGRKGGEDGLHEKDKLDKSDVKQRTSVGKDRDTDIPSSGYVVELQHSPVENSLTTDGLVSPCTLQRDKGGSPWASEQGEADDVEVDVLGCSSPIYMPFNELDGNLGERAHFTGPFKEEEEEDEEKFEADDDDEEEIDVIGEDTD